MMVIRITGYGQAVAIVVLLWSATVQRNGAAETNADDRLPPNLMEASLEQLVNIEVTSVSKKKSNVLDSPAAVYVVTQEEIRRSGATRIPEALRLVPGLEVAQLDARRWAISSRGFNGRFANKLLVMIDGRSVYTPLFAGVYWDVQDVVLEDVERIEVIRGPGGTLWGANAVNGVINIITKRTAQTQGGLVAASVGTAEPVAGTLRYGGKLDARSNYRVYAKYFDWRHSVNTAGGNGEDGWELGSGGFRVDDETLTNNTFTLQGDIYDSRQDSEGETFAPTPPYTPATKDTDFASGGNMLGRWTHKLSDTSDTTLQIYYDRTRRQSSILDEIHDTADVDFQHRFQLEERHDIIWGLGYRLLHDDLRDSFAISLDPDSCNNNIYNAFAQDEITLVKNRLRFILGSKFEHNDYTGFEIEPNARLLWTPDRRQTIWTAISRAVRMPSRVEEDARIVAGVYPPGTFAGDPRPAFATLIGSRDFVSEDLVAYEVGYRAELFKQLSFDVATFYNVYDNLRTTESGTPFTNAAPPYWVLPQDVGNKMRGDTYGIELAANWELLDWWRLRPAYTYLQMQLHTTDGSSDAPAKDVEGSNPHNQVQIRSSMDLTKDVDFDLVARYVDNLPSLGISSYITFDLRLAWRPCKHWEIALVGQNLLERYHSEYRGEIFSTPVGQVERSGYVKVTWTF